jgi:hypothetical protein
MNKLTLNLDALTVTTFETDTHESDAPAAAAATLATSLACCGGGCNTRLTCSTNLC